MFQKILIANRGEIACRIAATARRLGIATVAVHSDADTHAQHVKACDEAVRIGPASPRESYLVAERIVAAAVATGAQAVHPGYGFLSENEDFARACEDAGLVFIGPPASAIAAMGSKSAAKALMERAGVPLVPGYHGEVQEAAFLQARADGIGYPVLIKASAGGGGKGMRTVHEPQAFAAALASCQREALASFGDARVLIERYVPRPRHIEVQVFGDRHGHCVHLFERDCSVQRRHQKVLEEAPAPGMTPERRQQMGEAAVAAARSVGYVGAGTVEFICEQDGRFYFMEMNTRLQVEHPVTEAVTGLDLVEWQLRVAAGEPLPLAQHQIPLRGHAIEARICAENPQQQFLPSTGPLRVLRVPEEAARFEVAPVRIDSGVVEGDVISPHYDSMIAKLIVWGEDRPAALARMRAALDRLHIVGLHTNVAFVGRIVATDSFASARLDTALIEREHEALFPATGHPAPHAVGAAVAVILGLHTAPAFHACRVASFWDPWDDATGWRQHGQATRREVLAFHGRRLDVVARLTGRNAFSAEVDGQLFECRLFEQGPGAALVVSVDGERRRCAVYTVGDDLHVFSPGDCTVLHRVDPLRQEDAPSQGGGCVASPMPGKVIAVLVHQGQAVRQGDPVVVTEAMKMEHTLAAPQDGVVASVLCTVGDQVADGVELLRIEPA